MRTKNAVVHFRKEDLPGYILLGPFPGREAEDVLELLSKEGMLLSSAGSSTSILSCEDVRGTTLIAVGSGVHGYLVECDGSELEREHLQAFIKANFEPGAVLEIQGAYSPMEFVSIVSHFRFWHDGINVHEAGERRRERSDGTRFSFMKTSPTSI